MSGLPAPKADIREREWNVAKVWLLFHLQLMRKGHTVSAIRHCSI
jgi:hypothetical protein